ncbi:Alpha/Beta hydrolase protein [Thelonectria olida]|uniref:Alpha/Beta hydrolase protein n=1 Tax=Thelonectria olida TaxID=1576542 RepID=A0A9P8W1E2_9HYPO|nr:Alpha/Beta hydrolase protein [Thelonectria olida]
MLLKSELEYVDTKSDFKPLPKHGHLSQKIPEYTAAEAAIGAAFSPFWSCPDFATFRQVAGDADAAMPPGGPDRSRDVVSELLQFPARDGTMIELKVYKSPKFTQDATLMYRMHGGGWTVGRHEVDGAENVFAAANPNIVVVSVDYRKAPEHPFPQPLYDSYDSLLWCKENAKALGVNPERIIVSGSSAGANLAAALALEARNDGITGIVAQVLHFPAVCHPKFFPAETYELGSMMQNYKNPVLSASMWEAFLDAYMPHAEPDSRHSPLLATSHRNLPPALIQCAGADILRDEAFAYAEALQTAGVEVEIYGYTGVPHCFPGILTNISETSTFYKRYNAFLEKHIRNEGSR